MGAYLIMHLYLIDPGNALWRHRRAASPFRGGETVKRRECGTGEFYDPKPSNKLPWAAAFDLTGHRHDWYE